VKAYNKPNGKRCPWKDGAKVCNGVSVGKSRYCAVHRDAARKRYYAKIREASQEREAQRMENERTLAAAELAGETAQRSKPTPCECVLWVPSGRGSLQAYLRKHAGFEKAEIAGKGLERECSHLSYALAYAEALKGAGQECRVIL
jgi:hypothetical protein